MKYIFIFEDGEPYQADEITNSDIKAFEDGVLDIINVLSMAIMVRTGEWIALQKWEGEG
jgi:hypothetical protein